MYVVQIENNRLHEAVIGDACLDAPRRVPRKCRGLWFTDESFVMARRRT